jgi:hypothetical protein
MLQLPDSRELRDDVVNFSSTMGAHLSSMLKPSTIGR